MYQNFIVNLQIPEAVFCRCSIFISKFTKKLNKKNFAKHATLQQSTPLQVLFSEFCETFQEGLLVEYLRTTASENHCQ